MCFCRFITKRTCIFGALFLTTALYGQDYSPPQGYYDLAENVLGTDLRNNLHDIIDNHRNLGYDAMRTAPRVLDVDPNNSNNIILIYSGISVAGHLFNSAWNREHLWPQSYGADSNTVPGADFHHLFPADPGVNSTRGNKIYDYTDPNNRSTNPKAPGSSYDSNSWEPRDEDKGRVARAMLYMDLRYDGSDSADFALGETANQSTSQFAKLSVLLEWNRLYPPDEYERRRNHLIHTGFSFASFSFNQGNRNPFVDFPDIAEAIFTSSDYIAWGTWRWKHFSIDQLLNKTQTEELDDPDEDFLDNLIEYSANFDPTQPTSDEVLTVTSFGSLGTQIRYNRQKSLDKIGLSYELQASVTPLREETWQTLHAQDFTNQFISDQGETELVTINLPASSSQKWFRLKVTRQKTAAISVSSVYNPIIRTNAENADSIFIYQSKLNESDYKQSPWMGYVIDDDFPWVYHYEHKWIYFNADRDDSVWFYDSTLGWSYTNSDIYPQIFSISLNDWFLFLENSLAPARWFYQASKGWIQEQNLLETAI